MGCELRRGSQTGMPPGIPKGAMCVQRFDDSLDSAIHIKYRISLRSSSLREPRDPLSKVVSHWQEKSNKFVSSQGQNLIVVNIMLGLVIDKQSIKGFSTRISGKARD
jgi:hypothetical protein